MKFSVVAALTFVSGALAGLPSTLSWDPVYSSASTSTLSLACSDGQNGLYTKGYKTLGAIPRFAMVAASPEVAGKQTPPLLRISRPCSRSGRGRRYAFHGMLLTLLKVGTPLNVAPATSSTTAAPARACMSPPLMSEEAGSSEVSRFWIR
jgi:hypothetical protein